MKKVVVVVLLFILAKSFFAQSINNQEIIAIEESKYSKYFSFTDPLFPNVNLYSKDFEGKGDYKRALKEYAKNHSPVPEAPLTGNETADLVNYTLLLNNWYANNSYFPRFIEYHLFHKNMSFEDDIFLYKKAVKVWLDHQKTIQK